MSRRIVFLIPLFLVVAAVLMFALGGASDETTSGKTNALIDHGQYLAKIAGCNDCHTPKIMTEMGPMEDTTRLFMGHPAEEGVPEMPKNLGEGGWIAAGNSHFTAWAGPWGISFAVNLTPSTTSGIGLWKEESFIKAMRTGKHRGIGRPILPPMPWFNIAVATDEDLKALFAYFRSLKPIDNVVPQPVMPGEKK